jgi:hypothetical protein
MIVHKQRQHGSKRAEEPYHHKIPPSFVTTARPSKYSVAQNSAEGCSQLRQKTPAEKNPDLQLQMITVKKKDVIISTAKASMR